MTSQEIAKADAAATTITGFDVPNLDGYSLNPVDYAAMERVLDCLALFCESKRMSMTMRLAGDIEAALAYERRMDMYYDRLPAWAKW